MAARRVACQDKVPDTTSANSPDAMTMLVSRQTIGTVRFGRGRRIFGAVGVCTVSNNGSRSLLNRV